MKKRILFSLLLFFMTVLLGTASVSATGSAKYESTADLDGCTFGMIMGAPDWDAYIQENYPHSKIVYYNMYSDLILALKTGKIDAFLVEQPIIAAVSSEEPEISYFPDILMAYDYAFVFSGNRTEMTDEFNTILQKSIDDGSVEKLREKWFTGDYKTAEPLQYASTGEKGTMLFLTDSENPPFSFYKENTTVGLEVDIAAMVFAEMGYGMEIKTQQYDSIITSLVAGKGDIGGAMFSITDERDGNVTFSLPYYNGGTVIAMLKSNMADSAIASTGTASSGTVSSGPASSGTVSTAAADTKSSGFWGKIKSAFISTFVTENRWQLILQGLGTTLIISGFTALFGTLLGALLCAMKRTGKALNKIAKAFIDIVQGTPVLVLLMILYFIIFSSPDISAVGVAILAFSLNLSAYVAEMLFVSIEGVDKGQIEASRASGFSSIQTYRHIILPQAIKQVLPVYKGEIISMVKMTSVVGYITIQDLTRMGDLIRSRTYEPFFPLITTALIYLLISAILIKLMGRVQFRLDRKLRKRTIKGVIL